MSTSKCPRALIVVIAMAALSVGCAPEGKFLRAQCQPQQHQGQAASLAFVSTFQAVGFADTQLVYRVSLLDGDGLAFSSSDGRYETPDGGVAASRTLLVHRSPQVFENMTVSIPANELHITPNSPVVVALFGVYTADGQPVAHTRRLVTIASGRKHPELPELPPEPIVAQWPSAQPRPEAPAAAEAQAN